MTHEEAEKKAQELWGAFAFVHHDGNSYWVGELNGPIKLFYGQGNNWEEAFNMASKNIN